MANGVPRYRAPESPRRPRFPSSLLFSSSSWLTSKASTVGERDPDSVKLTFLNRFLKFVGIRRQQQRENFIKREVAISYFTTRRLDLYFLQRDEFADSLEFIGRGGSGEVYKMEIPSYDRKFVALKKIMVGSMNGANSREIYKREAIMSETSTVGRIRHRNLMPLLAHVARADCHFLIFDFMENGSLEDALRKPSDVGSLELDWLTRHKIAMGIAAGLEYLHFDLVPKIIHRDLKPSNILLDCDMVAKITDFGLAVHEPDTESTRIAGSYGYMAPEYRQTNNVTIKCDVYSFGVVLGILVSGRFPTDEFFRTDNYSSYVKWLRDIVNSENPTAAIDPKLTGNGYEMQMLHVLRIARACTADDPEERPNSIDVERMLSRIQH